MVNYKFNCNSGIGGSGGTGGSVGIGCVTFIAFTVGAAAVTPPGAVAVVLFAAVGAATGAAASATVFPAVVAFVAAGAAAGAVAGAATVLLVAITCGGTAGIAGMSSVVGNKLVLATVVTGDIVTSGAATAGAIVAIVGAGGIVGTCGGT